MCVGGRADRGDSVVPQLPMGGLTLLEEWMGDKLGGRCEGESGWRGGKGSSDWYMK